LGIALLLGVGAMTQAAAQPLGPSSVEEAPPEPSSVSLVVGSPTPVIAAPDRALFPHVVIAPTPAETPKPSPACIGRRSPYHTAYPDAVCTLDQAAAWVQRVWKRHGWGTISVGVAKRIIAGTVAARPAPDPPPKAPPRAATTTPLPADIAPAARSVIRAAVRHLGAPYVFGATGPRAFDCSGLVWYAFRSTGNFAVIGDGAYRRGSAIYRYFLSRHLASRTDGRPGDIVAYDGGMHLGIYLGNGRVISALLQGVSIHGLYAIGLPFTDFLHTGLDD
jgi:cell wall-associated NlpC family hydrolase